MDLITKVLGTPTPQEFASVANDNVMNYILQKFGGRPKQDFSQLFPGLSAT
eukprot:Pgem_evm1s17474